MTTSTSASSQRWSSRWLFVLAAAGSAVGLGNIWKFPYIAGENGGGAFVLIYLVCIAAVGIPIMVSEVLLGRQGRSSPIHTMRKLAKAAGRSQGWSVVGWMGVLAGFLILSYYAVIAGWAVNYVWLSGSGVFEGVSAQTVGQSFDDFLASPLELIAYQTAFMILTIWIVGRGVTKGLEAAIRWFMPLLFLLLIALLVYSFNSGGFDQGFAFMFDMKWDAVTADSWLIAMGQAFFTLSLGMGTMMAYGAYVPDDANLGTSVVTIAALDTLIAVAAGLAIFPIVFANGLEVAQGPGLVLQCGLRTVAFVLIDPHLFMAFFASFFVHLQHRGIHANDLFSNGARLYSRLVTLLALQGVFVLCFTSYLITACNHFCGIAHRHENFWLLI